MYQVSAPLDDDRALVAAARQGDLASCRQIVQRYSLEALRTAYLLTDSRPQARQIARNAFLDVFKHLPAPDDEVDLRSIVVLATARAFLFPVDEAPDIPAAGLSLLEGRSERFQVDDQRTRTRAGLALLAPAERIALVLREFNDLDVEQFASLLDERPDQTTTALEASRARIRNYLDLWPEDSLRAVLVGAAFDAPADNLWQDIEDDIRIVLQQIGARRRMLSAAVVTVMMAVMVVSLVILLRDPAPDETIAAEPRFVTDAVNDPPPFPTIAPPRATGTNPARAVRVPSPPPPLQDVPDTLLMALQGNGATDGLSHLTELRPRHSARIQPFVDWPRLNRERWAPVMSPDGQVLIMGHFEPLAGTTRVLVSAVDSRDQSIQWQVEMDQVAGVQPGEKVDVFVSLAVDDRHVFVMLHYWKESTLLQMVVLDQATGNRVNAWPVNIAGHVANDVRVLRPPDSDHVYVYAITQAQPALVGQMHISFYGYEVETGREVHGKTLVEAENRRVFHMYRGQVTADGRSLYGVTYRNNRGVLAVQFFDLLTATVQPAVQIPFNTGGGRHPVMEAVSHDGRWFYIFSPRSAEMAIVDLQQRQLLGIIPLEIALPDVDRLGVVNLQNNAMQISPDGTRMYAIGTSSTGSTSSGVWVIDTTSWQVVEHWAADTSPVGILLSGDGGTLYLHERSMSIGSPAHGQITGIDTGSGGVLFQETLAFLPDSTDIQLDTLASLYRKQFGQSPSVNGVEMEDNRTFTTLPAVKAKITPIEVQAGERVTIEVRFVDPLSGEEITAEQTGARYQPPGGVRAILRDTTGNAADVILELGRRGYAEYHGTVSVEASGQWSLSLVNDWSGDMGSSQIVSTSVTLQVISAEPGFFGTGSLRIFSSR